MKSERPIYISVTQYAWPLTAIGSILHRLTGIALVAGTFYLLWLLSLALESEQGFWDVKQLLELNSQKVLVLITLIALFYHLFAGIKHLLMDLGIGETLIVARRATVFSWVATFLASLLAGLWLFT